MLSLSGRFAFAPDGRLFAANSKDSGLMIGDVARRHGGRGRSPRTVTYRPWFSRRRPIVSLQGSSDPAVRCVDVARRASWSEHLRRGTRRRPCAALSPDGRFWFRAVTTTCHGYGTWRAATDPDNWDGHKRRCGVGRRIPGWRGIVSADDDRARSCCGTKRAARRSRMFEGPGRRFNALHCAGSTHPSFLLALTI